MAGPQLLQLFLGPSHSVSPVKSSLQTFCITCKIISKHFVILLLDSWPYSIFKGPDEVANMCQGYTDAVFSVCLTCVKGAEYQLSPALAFSVNGPVFENEVCAS